MFDSFRRMLRKASKTSRLMMTGAKQPKWSERDYKAFADEGYRRNVIAFQAVHKTAQAVSSIPMIVRRRPGGDILTDHPLITLINNPNPSQSRQELIEAIAGYYRIAGNAYIERSMVGRSPRELYALRPDRMAIVPGEAMPSAYVYRVGQEKVVWDVDQISGDSDILHLRTFNPLDDWYGMSPIEAGAYAVDAHNEANKYTMALLQNSAMPSGALEVTGQPLGDEEYNRLKSEIDTMFSGSSNAGRPMLLEGGMKWTQMGLSPQSMAILETRYASARDVSLALGVPPLLLNIPGDSTYSNYKEARLAFYEESVIPLAERIVDELNAWLSPLFGGAVIELDLDRVPAIAEKRRELWDMANQATDLTIDERRQLRGYEAIEGGDTLYIPSGMIPLSFDLPSPTSDPATAANEAYGGAASRRVAAMDSGQVSSLQAIIRSVSDGSLPADAAIIMIDFAFPAIDPATVRQMVAAAKMEPNA